ncbi:MAG: hypothetical protein AAF628_36900 [Planctomycetota bacterium]
MMSNRLAAIGLLIAFVALGVAVFADDLRGTAPPSPPPESRSIKERTLEVGKKLLREKVLGEPAQQAVEAPTGSRDAVALTHMGLGLLAIVLGVLAWIQKAHARLAGATIAVGLVAAAWQYVLVGLALAIVVLVLSNLGG